MGVTRKIRLERVMGTLNLVLLPSPVVLSPFGLWEKEVLFFKSIRNHPKTSVFVSNGSDHCQKTTVVLSEPSLYLFLCLCLIKFISQWFPSGQYRSLVSINPQRSKNSMKGKRERSQLAACCMWDHSSGMRAVILLFLPQFAPSYSI